MDPPTIPLEDDDDIDRGADPRGDGGDLRGDRMKAASSLRRDLIRFFDSAFPKVQQDRWPFTIEDLADGIMATIGEYFPASSTAGGMPLTRAADLLKVTPATLRQQIANGKLRAKKVGRDWSVSAREVERYRAESRRR